MLQATDTLRWFPQLTLAKTGKGSVFIGTVSDVTTIAMTGTGAVSANSTDNLNLIQQGAGSVLASVVSQANLTYAGGKNQTRINGLGTKDAPTVATYYNSGAFHRTCHCPPWPLCRHSPSDTFELQIPCIFYWLLASGSCLSGSGSMQHSSLPPKFFMISES